MGAYGEGGREGCYFRGKKGVGSNWMQSTNCSSSE